MNWFVGLRKIGTELINGTPFSLHRTLHLHAEAMASSKQVERRAGFCDGVRMKTPEPKPSMPVHHDATSRCDYIIPVTIQDVASIETQPGTTPSIEDELNERWMQQIGSARQSWSRLTESELQASRGMAEKLIALIQVRYSISAEDATKRVKCFFDKQQS